MSYQAPPPMQYPQQAYPQQAYPQQAGALPWPGAQGARAPSRNVGMMIGGAVLLLIALGAAGLFAWNLHTYLTIEDSFADDPVLRGGAGWVVEIVKAASLKRMTIFGSISTLFGIAGLVLGGLGLRKR